MTISLDDFTTAFLKTPTLQITTMLILGVILVNGATDAPNAIASLVASGGMELKPAVRMAAFFNFAGLALMTICNANVAYTICHMVDFGDSPGKALTALCAALISIILWSAVAWCFGIPTSESHALIAGLTGAAIAIHNGLSGIHGMEWLKVLYGLAASSILGFSLGWMGGKGLSYRRLFKVYAGFYKPASHKPAQYKPVSCKSHKPASYKSALYKSAQYKPGGNEAKYERGKRWIQRAQIAGAAAMADS